MQHIKDPAEHDVRLEESLMNKKMDKKEKTYHLKFEPNPYRI